MAILVTELAKVDVLANPTGSNVIGEVSGKIVRITTQKIIDMVSEQVQDPNKSNIAVTINQVTEDLTEINKDIQTIIQRLDNGDVNTGDITENITNITNNLNTVTKNLTTVTNKVNSLESTVNTLNNNYSRLQSTVNTATGNISNLTSRVSSVESKINTANSSISDLKTRMNTMEGYLQMLRIIAGEA